MKDQPIFKDIKEKWKKNYNRSANFLKGEGVPTSFKIEETPKKINATYPCNNIQGKFIHIL